MFGLIVGPIYFTGGSDEEIGASTQSDDDDGAGDGLIILILVLVIILIIMTVVVILHVKLRDHTEKSVDGVSDIELVKITSVDDSAVTMNPLSRFDDDLAMMTPEANSYLTVTDAVDSPSGDVAETTVDDLFGNDVTGVKVSDEIFAGGTIRGRTVSTRDGPTRQMFLPGSSMEDGAHDRLAYVQSTSVHNAVANGELSALKGELAKGSSPEGDPVDLKNFNMTPLALASSRNDLEAASVLISAGAKVTSVSGALGLTPLHFAAQAGSVLIIDLLVDRGANPSVINESTDDAFTPLVLAVDGGHHEAVVRLLALGADSLSTSGPNRYTALHIAVEKGIVAVAETLAGFSPVTLDATDAEGNTPLHTAAAQCQMNLVLLLLEAGASVNKTNAIGLTPYFLVPATGDPAATAVKLLLRSHHLNDYKDLAPSKTFSSTLSSSSVDTDMDVTT